MRFAGVRIAIFFLLCFGLVGFCCAQELVADDALPSTQATASPNKAVEVMFYGEVNSSGVNLRADSTVTAEVIANLNQKEVVEVVREAYDWLKIRLPESVAIYISKNFVSIDSEDKIARVSKDRVNVRSSSSETSSIVGKARKDQEITVLDDSDKDWYKIKPIENSFGWVHKNFIDKITDEKRLKSIAKADKKKEEKPEEEPEKNSSSLAEDEISLSGIIKPRGRFFRQKATHQLNTYENKIYFLKGNKETLDTLNNRRVKITGKLAPSDNQKYPLVEIVKIIEQVE